MRLEEGIRLDFIDVLLKPRRSTLISRKEVNLECEFKFFHSNKIWRGIPIMTANMASCGTFGMAKVLSKYHIITTFNKFYKLEDYKNFFKTFNDAQYIGFTIGIRDKDLNLLDDMIKEKLINNFFFIVIDVPNGYLERFLEIIKLVRKKCSNHIIIAGNVVSNEIGKEIILNGADIVKIGIGSGSSCTTRKMTGVGYPQLSAIIECSNPIHKLVSKTGTGLIISDGGIIDIGDFGKALCAGSDFVMSGSLFSGFEQSSGKIIIKDNKKYKEYYGSSSNKAMIENYGKKESYRASEGRYLLIPHKGDINFFLQDLFGSLRSTATYIGARNIKEFSKLAIFIKVNNQLNNSLVKYSSPSN